MNVVGEAQRLRSQLRTNLYTVSNCRGQLLILSPDCIFYFLFFLSHHFHQSRKNWNFFLGLHWSSFSSLLQIEKILSLRAAGNNLRSWESEAGSLVWHYYCPSVIFVFWNQKNRVHFVGIEEKQHVSDYLFRLYLNCRLNAVKVEYSELLTLHDSECVGGIHNHL